MQDKYKNKVYINPNYTGLQRSNNMPLSQHNTIYINQNFVKSTAHPSNVNKIFVNPNFINAKNNLANIQAVNQQNLINKQIQTAIPIETKLPKVTCSNGSLQNQIPESSRSTTCSHNVTLNRNNEKIENKSRYSLVRNIHPQSVVCSYVQVEKQNENTHNLKTNNLQLPLVKSRYHLIRRNEGKIPICQTQEKSKLKINKYKMITVTNISNNVHNKDRRSKCITSKYVYTPQRKALRSSFSTPSLLNKSLIKNTSLISPLIHTKINQKIRRSNIKQKSSYKAAIENIKGKSKINNIPCPLFSKYGKCLRNVKGKCEYLHDKKHVALCRKFLKGICHDDKCCFSHELSMNKMPTCYFYLKGMCFKDNCPYLHVKLSEKTKVCKDFIQGYCEKGENCLFRHVQPLVRSKSLSVPSQLSPNTIKKFLLAKKVTIAKVSKTKSPVLPEKDNSKKSQDTNTRETIVDSRYFKEIVDEELNNCNVIKPSRCKLGALPSFIQL